MKTGTRFDAEFRIRRSTGEYRWFKARAVPIRDSAGVILRWYCANTDVHELSLAEQQRPAVDVNGAAGGGSE